MPRVLLADDSGIVLRLLARKLGEAGYEVVGMAHDGNEAVRLYAALKPGLVLLDITMPNKDGRESLVDILTLDPAAKVIMLTAVKDPAVEKECMAKGALAFCEKADLMKPGAFETVLLSVIQNALKAA